MIKIIIYVYIGGNGTTEVSDKASLLWPHMNAYAFLLILYNDWTMIFDV